MTPAVQIQSLSRHEKLQTMELLWEELSQDSASLELPPWHEAALRETEGRVQSGDERILDWREAKEELRKLFK